MVSIRTMTNSDIDEVSMLISELNMNEESYIGYCGTEVQEIANSFVEDITDVPYTESFVVAYEEGELVGVLGFDASLENNSAEIWGPFVKETEWVNQLWAEMEKLLPPEIHNLSMFTSNQNRRLLSFAKELGFVKQSEQTILTVSREDRHQIKGEPIVELTEEYFSEIKQLHNKAFPETYYNGQQLIECLSPNRKVFIVKKSNQLKGYIYVEAEPAFGEASIEYMAVIDSERGKGFGKQLVNGAVQWIFTYEDIAFITLCVDAANETAIKLYKTVGFERRHDLVFFTKE
ncbi:GNAT family N-acetyltransferase [Bacillus hwajinpoensis]|uniref:GNAT family N-acetyltransferase n=1 Tax=Guptibacillus hwajinpoensis TaxID=208199 RepID=A0A845F0X7_9BACL|nr:GNAT family N-acetyltransferase [Pseudalkalibacillus hwajinpoensis]MYL64418.1 GNAT family N-acetyltransferase [Pseudalkalibacillus hwajinpoensis]